jgi:hypothetical protein
MLSIIISSYQPHYFSALTKNIAETCGIQYEIIKIDNPGKMSICEAYNKGAQISKFENLLFIHEDILFVTTDWGKLLIETLNLPNCGVVGVAGGNYYSYIPAGWWNKGHDYLHIIQCDESKQTFQNKSGFPDYLIDVETKTLDGVFLASKKKVYQDIRFDERLGGFHGYDLLFSLQAQKKYKNYVTSKILIKHFSKGNISKEWFKDIIKVREILGHLPMQEIDQEIEMHNFYKFISYLKLFKFDKIKSFQLVLKYLNPKIIGVKNTLKVLKRAKNLL